MDSDPADPEHFHIVARSHRRAIGCARIMPLVGASRSMVDSTIGEQLFDNVLRGLGTSRRRAGEASRWIALPEYRGELGRSVVAATWAVARWLSIDVTFVLAGTRRRQDIALSRMGARPVSGLRVFPSRTFDDELRLLYFDVARPSLAMLEHMDRAAEALGLWSLIPPEKN
jgi:hypothetical protein